MNNLSLNIKDLLHYQYFKKMVMLGNVPGNEPRSHYQLHYHTLPVLVMHKWLSIKALGVTLPTLPKNKIYTHHRLFGGKAWA